MQPPQQLFEKILLTIPLVPPSVNHYKKQVWRNGKPRWIWMQDAIAYKHAVALMSRGDQMKPGLYSLSVTVYLGKGGRGDGDNFNKVLGDSLQYARVVESDAKIKVWKIRVDRDWSNPRTEIEIKMLDKE